MGTIYRKTAKGLHEVQQRTLGLSPRERSLLILVDGVRSSVELARLIPQLAPETLQRLAEGGFIEVAGLTAPPPGTPLRPVLNIGAVRVEAVRRLLDQLGEPATALAQRIEQADSLETLKPLLVSARSAIASRRGEPAAAAYIAALSAL